MSILLSAQNSHPSPTANHHSHAPNIPSTPNVYLMSSPHSQPENAACAVPLSDPSADSAPDTAPAGQPTATEAVLLSCLPAASSGEATLSEPRVDVDQSLHHAVPPGTGQEDGQQHKKSWPSSHSLPQNGPSLLTQALASARGIAKHASATPPPASHQDKGGGPSATSPIDTAYPHTLGRINASAQSTSTTVDKQHAAPLQHGDNTSLTEPRTSPSPTMAAPATVPATSLLVSRHDAMSVPSSFTRSALTEVRDMFYENRRSVEQIRRRSSTDSARPLLRAAVTDDESTTPTKASYLTGNPLPQQVAADASTAKDPYHRHRPPPPEHRFTLGPEKTEKIWSIGSGEGLGGDGLVEKSVTEVMTGIEHNARSRKASYSLRFFKEGLPSEDKARRRDRDTKAAQRERLPAPAEEDSEETSWTRSQLLREIRQRRQSYASEEPTRAGIASPSLASPASTSIATEADTDYFSLENINATHQTTPTSSGTPPPAQQGLGAVQQPGTISPELQAEPIPPAEDAEAEKSQVEKLRRKSGDSTEVGESHDERDADESGEEKISSAVFVPHQEAGEARSRDVSGTSSGAVIGPRSIVQDDSHHWLVKADELELHSDENEEHPGRLTRLQSIESLISNRGDHFSESPSEEFAFEGEEEAASQFTQAPSQVATQYADHVHGHQHRISQPLEAIELIPYKHQVGGHTTLWRFSRRAVCKQLNNRENEFYETIERYHRDLLPFLPRYVNDARICYATGVLCDFTVDSLFAFLQMPPLVCACANSL